MRMEGEREGGGEGREGGREGVRERDDNRGHHTVRQQSQALPTAPLHTLTTQPIQQSRRGEKQNGWISQDGRQHKKSQSAKEPYTDCTIESRLHSLYTRAEL